MMEARRRRRSNSALLTLCVCVSVVSSVSAASPEVCTNSLLPGAKGDQGEVGDEGDQGRLGKNGPPGFPGIPGEKGLKGDVGQMGKMGPAGDTGAKGDKGLCGLPGLKGKPGSTCDCGRYRKVVGQLDVNTGRLSNAVNFLKKVILGLKETEESYFLLVKEAKRFKEASLSCRLRGGALATPTTPHANGLMADYLRGAGLTRVHIGAQSRDKDGAALVHVDSDPLQSFAGWSPDEELNSTLTSTSNSSCVELLSSGTWGRVECEAAMFFICEFPKSRRRGGRTG